MPDQLPSSMLCIQKDGRYASRVYIDANRNELQMCPEHYWKTIQDEVDILMGKKPQPLRTVTLEELKKERLAQLEREGK